VAAQPRPGLADDRRSVVVEPEAAHRLGRDASVGQPRIGQVGRRIGRLYGPKGREAPTEVVVTTMAGVRLGTGDAWLRAAVSGVLVNAFEGDEDREARPADPAPGRLRTSAP
jgi:hypothetical protein